MKTINYWFKRALCLTILASVISSCSDDDSSESADPADVKYVLAFQSSETTTDDAGNSSFNELLLDVNTIEELESGEISAIDNGLPLREWRFWHQTGNTVFSTAYTNVDETLAFQVGEEGEIEEVNDFTSNNSLFKNYASLDSNTMLYVDLISSLSSATATSIDDLVFSVVDANTGLKTATFSSPIDNHLDPTNIPESYLPWVTGMVLRGDKLFVSYHKLAVDGTFNTIDGSKANIAVLNYADFSVEKLIEDSRSNAVGTNGTTTGIIKTENDDIYTYSSSTPALGLTGTDINNPSVILRIKNGSTDFDSDYIFDVENAANGGKVYSMDYLGNNKALLKIVVEDNLPSSLAWEAYTEQGEFLKVVIADLENKTLTNVQGFPLHANRYSAPVFVENGKAYLSARTGVYATTWGNPADFASGETNIYVIDIENATAVKGAKVNGIAIKGIFKIDNGN